MNNSINGFATEVWYHGTDASFEKWTCPPPVKKGSELLVPHSAIFLAKDKDYAAVAGKYMCTSFLAGTPRLIDTVCDTQSSEKLRREVSKNPFMRRTVNVDHSYWHDGWKTGDVLRFAYQDASVLRDLQTLISRQSRELGISLKVSEELVGLNLTRGLIEEIVKATRKLGYDGFIGYEVDRHSVKGQKKSRKILSLLSAEFLTSPVWCTSE